MTDWSETIVVIGVVLSASFLWNISKELESINRVLHDRLPSEPDDDDEFDDLDLGG